MGFKNYFSVRKASLRYEYFCYIDTDAYLADALFQKHEVDVKFQDEAYKPGQDYVIIFCKARKSDVGNFQKALDELKNKMILLGHPDYQTFCEEFCKELGVTE